MRTDILLNITLSITICIAASTAQAATVNAFAETVVGTGITATTTTDNETSPTSASAQADDPRGEASGLAASDDSGRLAASASFSGANGTFATVQADATYSETFTGTAGSPGMLKFFIPGATIGFSANNVAPLLGGYEVKVSFNGDTLFSSTADVETLSGSPVIESDLLLTQSGTILDSSFATGLIGFGLPDAGYVFDSFTRTLDLPSITGDNIITYSMRVFVEGLIGETAAIASIGDPLDLSQNPGVELTIGSTVPPVPVPAAVWLFGTALIGFVGLSRRRKVA